MTNIKSTILAAMAIIAIMATNGCQKPDNGSESTDSTAKKNYFVYDGFSFDINSVVRYHQGGNSVELWLSPAIGATTIAEIQAEGDYVVLCTNTSYLGSRDRFNSSVSKESYIRFGENHKYSYGDEGSAYIQVNLEGDEASIDFLAQQLHTKAAEPSSRAILQGSYKGAFTTETEQPYDNEWGINRNREKLSSAIYTTYENGSNSCLTFYANSTEEAFKLALLPSLVGKNIALPYTGSSSDIKLTYNNALEFNLSNAAGSLSTSINNGQLEVRIDATYAENRFRGFYKGEYEEDAVKLNRYIFNYEGTSLVGSGTYEIVKLMVENTGSTCKFFLSPSTGYDITGSNSTHMPILTVPSSIINNGKKKFTELTDWKFEFVEMQVGPFENEYKPYPSATDWIEINKVGNTYEVEFVLSGLATGMPESHIDVYYNGQAK